MPKQALPPSNWGVHLLHGGQHPGVPQQAASPWCRTATSRLTRVASGSGRRGNPCLFGSGFDRTYLGKVPRTTSDMCPRGWALWASLAGLWLVSRLPVASPTLTSDAAQCPDGWIQAKGSCFATVSFSAGEEPAAACRALGSQAVVPRLASLSGDSQLMEISSSGLLLGASQYLTSLGLCSMGAYRRCGVLQ